MFKSHQILGCMFLVDILADQWWCFLDSSALWGTAGRSLHPDNRSWGDNPCSSLVLCCSCMCQKDIVEVHLEVTPTVVNNVISKSKINWGWG